MRDLAFKRAISEQSLSLHGLFYNIGSGKLQTLHEPDKKTNRSWHTEHERIEEQTGHVESIPCWYALSAIASVVFYSAMDVGCLDLNTIQLLYCCSDCRYSTWARLVSERNSKVFVTVCATEE
jgi:hypothetical protein